MITGKIKSIKKIKKKEITYDIETKNHNFYANDILVHNCSDLAISNKIMPMMGTAGGVNIYIEMGVALGKGDFFEDSQDPKFTKIIKNWLECDRLKVNGTFEYKGVRYPKYTATLMPFEKKLELFQDDLDKLGIGRRGQVSLLDWITQYELTWLEDIENALTDVQLNKLKSGAHKELDAYDNSGMFYFGLDTAAGTVNPETLGLDYTALAIWVIRKGEFHCVGHYEWQGDPLEQYDEIKSILKMYNVQGGCIDYSNIGISFISMLQRDGISAKGIMYRMTDVESKKNMKMAMFENYQDTIGLGKAKYPKIWGDKDTPDEGKVLVSDVMYKAYIEHTMFQRKVKNGKTIQIEAKQGTHDDHINADMLCHWFMKTYQRPYDEQGDGGFWFIGSGGGFMNR